MVRIGVLSRGCSAELNIVSSLSFSIIDIVCALLCLKSFNRLCNDFALWFASSVFLFSSRWALILFPRL